jgi:hypothetical protein
VTDLARWALVVIGAVYFVTESALFAPVRVTLARTHTFVALGLYCPGCSGFWLGLACSPLFPCEPWWLGLPLSGVAAMGLAATWSKLTGGNAAWEAEAPLREPRHDETRVEAEDAHEAQGA